LANAPIWRGNFRDKSLARQFTRLSETVENGILFFTKLFPIFAVLEEISSQRESGKNLADQENHRLFAC
jgi:hypothetical protein